MTCARELKRLLRGVSQLISEEELARKLDRAAKEQRPLRIKYGADPSHPDLHLGHAVVLRKLRAFQDLGHQVVFIIGDFTGFIGDPTGVSRTRVQLPLEQVQENAKTYQAQAFRILDRARTEVVHNSDWFLKMSLKEALELAAGHTLARLLERDDFEKRLKKGQPISLHECFYPLLQGYDSVQVRADVELGGTDQTYNLLVGRQMQSARHQEPQVVMTMPLLPGTDGKQKMSKSFGNFVALQDPPVEMFGKLMRIPDDLIPAYQLLLTDDPEEEVKRCEERMKSGDLHARRYKADVAEKITAGFHGGEAAAKARERFDIVFSRKELPAELPEAVLPFAEGESRPIVRLLRETALAPSNSEAKRLVKQGGVRVDGAPVKDPQATVRLKDGLVIQAGRRRMIRLRQGGGTTPS